MAKYKHTYPDKIIPTVISDMMSYHKHGYTFQNFVDWNTHGRNYGEELRPFWDETKARYDEEHDSVSEDRSDEGRQAGQNRGRAGKQHV